jgi:hypothetical protein
VRELFELDEPADWLLPLWLLWSPVFDELDEPLLLLWSAMCTPSEVCC